MLCPSSWLTIAIAAAALLLSYHSLSAAQSESPAAVDEMLARIRDRFEDDGLAWDRLPLAQPPTAVNPTSTSPSSKERPGGRSPRRRQLPPRLFFDELASSSLSEAPASLPLSVSEASGPSSPSLATATPAGPPLSGVTRASPCILGLDADERGFIRNESRGYVMRWQTILDGDDGNRSCLPSGRDCHRLADVVPPKASHRCDASRLGCARGLRMPRVYVYECMDAAHRELLSSDHVSAFFDANVARNQYLSEVAMHRSLLLSPHRVRRPADADFFFVPFYSRLAYADRKAGRRVRRMQANLTASLERCLRLSKSWRRSGGLDHLVAISSTRDPRKLYGGAWPLLRRGVLLRIEAVDHRYRRGPRANPNAAVASLVVPYFVPHFEEDDAVSAATKRHSVCFFGSSTNTARRRVLNALRSVPGSMLALNSFAHFNPSDGAQRDERRRTRLTRRTLRQCKLCLVPAGITPSSRRFYEAIVAKCVPVLVSDRFETAFAHLLPLEAYAVRSPQEHPEALPATIRRALQDWPQLFESVQAVRSSFIYGLGMGAHASTAPACDAAHAVLLELRARFHERAARHTRSPPQCLANTAAETLHDRHWCT